MNMLGSFWSAINEFEYNAMHVTSGTGLSIDRLFFSECVSASTEDSLSIYLFVWKNSTL